VRYHDVAGFVAPSDGSVNRLSDLVGGGEFTDFLAAIDGIEMGGKLAEPLATADASPRGWAQKLENACPFYQIIMMVSEYSDAIGQLSKGIDPARAERWLMTGYGFNTCGLCRG
jgi:hypothetical protein